MTTTILVTLITVLGSFLTFGTTEILHDIEIPVESNLLAVTSCRAACFEFSPLPTVNSCHKNADCFMCWESCSMLHRHFHTWGPMCTLEDICFPGCRKACDSVLRKKHLYSYNMSLTVRSVYDPQKVKVTWDYDSGGKPSLKSVLYVVLLSDDSSKSREWHIVTETTSKFIYVKTGLLNGDTNIRLLAVNASGKIVDTVTSYFDSLVAKPNTVHTDENIISEIEMTKNTWKPQLKSIIQSENSVILTTVTWPKWKSSKDEAVKYEVLWNVIDDTMDITGHLYSMNNIVVLTLSPDSLYSIQIKCYDETKKLETRSEPLVIDTRTNYPDVSISATQMCIGNQFPYGPTIAAAVFVIVFLALTCCLLRKYTKSPRTEKPTPTIDSYI